MCTHAHHKNTQLHTPQLEYFLLLIREYELLLGSLNQIIQQKKKDGLMPLSDYLILLFPFEKVNWYFNIIHVFVHLIYYLQSFLEHKDNITACTNLNNTR